MRPQKVLVVALLCVLSADAHGGVPGKADIPQDIQVSGTIVVRHEGASKPAEHREFCVYAGDKRLATFRTDEAGRFAFRIPASRLEGMPRGPIRLTVRPAGYAQVGRDLLLGSVEVEVGADRKAVEGATWGFQKAPEAAVTGSVTIEAGAPLSSATVCVRFLEPSGNQIYKRTITTDGEGNFAIAVPLLENVVYDLEVTKRDELGYWYSRVEVVSDALSRPLRLACKRWDGNVVCVVAIQGEKPGSFALSHGQHLELKGHPDSGGIAMEPHSVTFYNVPPGEHEILLHPSSPLRKEYALVEGTGRFTLREGEPLPKKVEIFLRPLQAHLLEGTLVDKISHLPIVGTVLCGGESRQQVTTDADGRFRIPGLLEGEHVLTFRAENYIPKELRVTVPHPEPLTVELLRYPLFRGRVLNEKGQPLPGASIEFKPKGATRYACPKTDEQGKFTATLTSGKYLVDVLMVVDGDSKRPTGIGRLKQFEFTMGEEDRTADITVPQPVRWQGQIALPRQAVEAYDGIVAIPENEGILWSSSRLTADGHFDLWVVPGIYRLGLVSGKRVCRLQRTITLPAQQKPTLAITEDELATAERGHLDERGQFVWEKP